MKRSPHVDDVALFAFWGLQGGMLRTEVGGEQFDIYPPMFDMWGNDVIDAHVRHFGAEVVITLLDIWVLEEEYGNGFYWMPYMPIDSTTVPRAFISRLKKCYLPITYSQHAHELLNDLHIENAYIPHGVDTKTYRPMDAEGRAEGKRMLGFNEDDYVVGMVAANKAWPPRKGFPEAMEAFEKLRAKVPNAKLYIHTIASSKMNGPDLNDMAQSYDIGGSVRFTQDYHAFMGLSTEDMAKMYNGFDVFLLPSMGEGFGLPIIEAQACGVPVIVTDATSMPELVGAGWKIPISHNVWIPTGSWQVLPSVQGIVEALFAAYDARDDETLREKARAFAVDYDWDLIWEKYWSPLLSRVDAELTPRTYRRESEVAV